MFSSLHHAILEPSRRVLSEENLKLVRKWVDYCIEHHPECGNRELASIFPDQAEITLIDVEEMCLVGGETSTRYLALSYVWGQTPQYSAVVGNVTALHEPRSLWRVWSNIPTVIQNAISLTRQLDERYLWADSLCIVQDDASTKHAQLALMAEIYNSATATIIACAGADAGTALYPSSTVSESRNISSSGPIVNVTKDKGAGDYPYVYDSGIARPRNTSRILEIIAHSRYSQRGWTYQERLLSRRRIYFLENEIVFQCRLDMFSGTTMHSTEKVKLVQRYRSTVGKPDSGSLNQFESAKVRHKGQGSEWPAGMAKDDWDKGFQFWSRTVEEYSKKEFTFNSDILDGCTGILQAFQGYSGWPIMQGMPEPVLDCALLWVPTTTVERRPPSTIPGSKLITQFPSWSWLGWRGGVTFPLTRNPTHCSSIASDIVKFEKSSGGGDEFAGEKVDVRWNMVPQDHGTPKHSSDTESHAQAQLPTNEQSIRFLKFCSVTIPAGKLTFRRTSTAGQSYAGDPAVVRPHMLFQVSICIPEAEECGVLLGVSDPQLDEINVSAESMELILLSRRLRIEPVTLLNRPSQSFTFGQQMSATFSGIQPLETNHTFMNFPKSGVILNIMLIRWKAEVAERVSVGQISSEAWECASSEQKIITLG